MPRVFVVEDDESIRELVCYALSSTGLEVAGFERASGGASGPDFWDELRRQPPDLVLLDIMLPGEDGISVLHTIREDAATKRLPVILLTAKGSELDKVRGLDVGADDYITKPFSVLELISRVKAVLRRSEMCREEPELSVGPIAVDPLRREASAGGEPVTLTYKEFELLQFLLRNRGIVLSREKILSQVWGFDYEGETRTVDMHITTLRQKLGASGGLIKTVRSVGYKIED